MKIFLSWSGDSSRQVAEALYHWLPVVLPTSSVELFFSPEDLEAGSRWPLVLSAKLEDTDFGIVCLVPESVESRWIHFEAGALAKSISDSRLVPFLVGLSPRNLQGPLSMFHATTSERDDVLRLVQMINKRLGDTEQLEGQLEKGFRKEWPRLAERLAAIKQGLGQEAVESSKEMPEGKPSSAPIVKTSSSPKVPVEPDWAEMVDEAGVYLRSNTVEFGPMDVNQARVLWVLGAHDAFDDGFLQLQEIAEVAGLSTLRVLSYLEDLRELGLVQRGFDRFHEIDLGFQLTKEGQDVLLKDDLL